jgi:hypothetical protein
VAFLEVRNLSKSLPAGVRRVLKDVALDVDQGRSFHRRPMVSGKSTPSACSPASPSPTPAPSCSTASR